VKTLVLIITHKYLFCEGKTASFFQNHNHFIIFCFYSKVNESLQYYNILSYLFIMFELNMLYDFIIILSDILNDFTYKMVRTGIKKKKKK